MHPQLSPTEVTPTQLIEWARAGGVRITRAQLVRWHKAELIPRPRRRYLGRGRGTESLYPAIAQLQVLSVSRSLKASRNFRSVRWNLWYLGYPHLTETVRKDLLSILAEAEKKIRRGLHEFIQESPTNAVEAWGTASRSPGGFGPARRRVGKANAVTIALMVHELMLGEFGAGAGYEPGDLLLARAAIAATLGIGEDASLEAPLIRSELELASRELNLRAYQRALEKSDAKVLVRIRDESSSLFRLDHPMLPVSSAALPPVEFFLLWFGFRFISPTLAVLSRQLMNEPRFPKPEFPPLVKLKLDLMARDASDAKHPQRSGSARPKGRRRLPPRGTHMGVRKQ